MKSDLGKAKGLGSAHEGTHHWMMQRVTAIMMVPLSLWVVYSLMSFSATSMTYDIFLNWISHPIHAILMILFVLSSMYHAALGSQVVAEDYLSCEGFRAVKIIGMKIAFFALTVAGVFAVLKLAL